jgi:cysteine desulfurase
MGVAPQLARGAIRVSLGPANTAREVADFLVKLADVAQRLKRMNALAG